MSRMSASAAGHKTAELVEALLRDPRRPGSPDLLAAPGGPLASAPAPNDPGSPGALPSDPGSNGTAAPRLPAARPVTSRQTTQPQVTRSLSARGLPSGPSGFGTSAARALLPETSGFAGTGLGTARPVSTTGSTRVSPRIPASPPGPGASGEAQDNGASSVPVLYCPPAVRDDPALGEEVNERLVEWGAEVGVYPGQLDRVRSADFGRLIMLAHPETSDPERLLAAAKCALAEWSVDDHYLDGEAEEAHPELLGQRLAIAHSVIDQAHLPVAYAPQLEEAVRADPVMVALRDSLDNLGAYASHAQLRRLRHELAIMFVAYNQEAVWSTTGQRPAVWEFLMHRHENSFVPCMALIDTVAGYELTQNEFADPRVRRVFTLAGSASVIVNDLYSMGKEDPSDFSLPRLIATEENCSEHEAIERSVLVHDELMHTYERESAALALSGSPELRRFLAGVWAWLGGSREWHARTARYHGASAN